ncbi:MAG: UbiA family prenyltransferase [bacterium]
MEFNGKKIKIHNTIWDYIFLTRPILLVPVWAFFLIGYYRAGGERSSYGRIFLLTIIAYSILLAILYIINQLADLDSDRINHKHLLIAEGYMPRRSAYRTIVVLTILLIIFAVHLPLSIIILMLISFVFGLLYSYKIKSLPIADFLTNGIGYGFLNFSVGWLTQRPLDTQTIFSSLPYVLGVSAVFVNTTILDMEGDARCNYKTTAILLGKINSARWALLFIILCIIVSLKVSDFICLIPALISLPFFIIAAIQGNERFVILSIRISGPLLMLMVGITFPYFLIVAIVIFIFLRIYYKLRFDITYPGLA